MKTTMWAVMRDDNIFNVFVDELEAVDNAERANMFCNYDRYTVKRVTVTVDEEQKEKGE